MRQCFHTYGRSEIMKKWLNLFFRHPKSLMRMFLFSILWPPNASSSGMMQRVTAKERWTHHCRNHRNWTGKYLQRLVFINQSGTSSSKISHFWNYSQDLLLCALNVVFAACLEKIEPHSLVLEVNSSVFPSVWGADLPILGGGPGPR